MSDENGYLSHYGTPRHSGRYPWGSGDDPFQHTGSWLSVYNDMKSSGKFKSDTEIARALGILHSLDSVERLSSKELVRSCIIKLLN